MRFSIVTICYNAETVLRRTIASVNEQTHAEVQHIFIDGGSTDGSVALIRRLAQRQVRIISERDEGISDAFNKGTTVADGEYVCYLNAGDTFADAEVLSKVAAEIARVPSTKPAVYFGDFYSEHDGIRLRHHTSAAERDFAWDNPVNHQSVFISLDLARRFPYDRRLKLGMDYDLWLRLLPQAEFVKLPFAVAVFALDGRSSNPAWAVHKLIIRRTLWHVNRGSRIPAADLWQLLWRATRLRLGHAIRSLLGRSVQRRLRREKARYAEIAAAPQVKAA